MREIEKMQRYIARANVKDDGERYGLTVKELKELLELIGVDSFACALIVAFEYGKAKGYRAAAGRRVRASEAKEPIPEHVSK